MKILFAASEAVPFAASGGLADVVGSLPKAIKSKRHDCRVVMPLYKSVAPEFRDKMVFVTNITVDVSWRKQYCGIFMAIQDGITYYFIDNEYYFSRDGLYGFYDDCERFVFFDRAVLEMLKYIDFTPDIINCNDWQTALIPVYYNVYYKYQQGYDGIKTVYTIHNIEYQGKYGKEVLSELMGIPMYNAGLIEYDGSVNMMKGAIETSDMITTVSPSYAWEILDPWYAHGLDRILVTKQYKLRGIMNGIDTKLYDPEKDKFIAVNYSAKKVAGKEKCKEAILAELGLTPGDEPLIGIVTRFVRHKGIDLIRCVFEEMVRSGIKFAVLGSGEKIYEDFFLEMAARYPDKVSVTVGFIPELSHRIYAGADMFLMPSQSEPCGLAQMIAMRYGTIPIVRETGGLRDSVRDNGGENGNGFTFKTYNANDMLDAVKRARKDYEDKQVWDELVERAMECDHSWSSSAEMYIDTYKELLAAE
ncbi:glycogen synthase GlgA [Ruminococcus flavefaciens]|uniref:glycogen synthase GlgA n=1 Tax=Ruminococcus flavefaciens TaxID=1265 RepID=UPI0026EC461E|nr:glycogen synthase GlgA [Ruminococcus flavefaciens]MDD7515697.1 glycogen synthase GlgA [Ruminococcus flavefaciens]MDY5690317.1 glycogen synthase GlgA [Ruminococcus flavefaciens]